MTDPEFAALRQQLIATTRAMRDLRRAILLDSASNSDAAKRLGVSRQRVAQLRKETK